MLLRTVEDLVKSIENGSYLLAVFLLLIIIFMIIGFVLASITEFNKNWINKWLDKILHQDKDNK